MMRHYRGGAPEPESSSSDEEDAFSALARKAPKKSTVSNKKQKTTTSVVLLAQKQQPMPSETELPASSEPSQKPELSSTTQEQKLAASTVTTSSMKRHHVTLTDARKLKMDALLEELEHEKIRSHSKNQPHQQPTRGSFVQPGEENSTTNLFVGNLSPSITEEQLTDLFSQFGEKRVSRRDASRVFWFERALAVL
jgi:hypothetical protein